MLINIPRDRYEEICSGEFDIDGYFKLNLSNAFRAGIQLPKGHGRLIDADALEYFCNYESRNEKCVAGAWRGCNQCQYHTITEYEINDSPTIIEADKDGE